MKKLFAFCAGLLAVLNQTAVTALAAEPEAAGAAAQTPLWLCIPFAGLLLGIAVLPLVKAEVVGKAHPSRTRSCSGPCCS